MGKYINTTSDGSPLPANGKATALLKDGATVVNAEWQEDLVCVVDNGPFEAAGYAYSKSEFEAFNLPNDYRPKVWLSYPHAKELAV